MNREISAHKYSEVHARKIDWLWYPYIAFGKITLLQGDPGDGKSTFILQLASLLTRGRNLPDGSKAKKPINVIYQCKEDSPEDTIKPRLILADADCDRVFFFSNEPELALDDQRLENAIRNVGAKLVIFDPIQSFIPRDADMMNAVKMRSVMSALSKVAEQCGCAIVLVGHLTKDSGNKSLYRGLGSIDIAAVARSILMIYRDEDNPSVRIMAQIKNNLGPEGMDILFELKEEQGFEWKGTAAHGEIRKDDIVKSPMEKAESVVRCMLQDGDAKSVDILEHLDLMGISGRTAYRAKKALNVNAYKRGNAWYWHLPADNQEK